MPRKYKLKNPYYRNARISVGDTIKFVHMFLKGIKPSIAAQIINVSEVTAQKIYRKLDTLIWESEFMVEFAMALDKYDSDLWRLFHGLRTKIFGSYGIDQILCCARNCETDTPPPIIREMRRSGKYDELLKKRTACKTCQIKICGKEPANVSEAAKKIPEYLRLDIYSGDPEDLMSLWLDVLDYMSDYRSIPERETFAYIFRGIYASILIRASFPMIDYRNMLIKYGDNPNGQSVEEAEEIMKYQSSLDRILLDHLLGYLEADPI